MVDNAQMLSDALAEIKQLKTKLAALEAQEPVMWAYQYVDGTWHDASNTEHSVGMKGLYAAAGAAPVQREPTRTRFDYFALHKYAEEKRLDYNELCAVVKGTVLQAAPKEQP